jgi:hypothetical protein
VEIPSKLPSDCGMDYVPLATMLATAQYEEADQVRAQHIMHPRKRLAGWKVFVRSVSSLTIFPVSCTAAVHYPSIPIDSTVYSRCLD